MEHAEFVEYVNGLEVGERVIETEKSSCMHGREGTVYISQIQGPTFGSKCVKWDAAPGESGQMGTSVTHGTRRITDQ